MFVEQDVMNILQPCIDERGGWNQASKNMDALSGQPMNSQSEPASLVKHSDKVVESNATKDKDLRYTHSLQGIFRSGRHSGF